jgi:putative ABC transport system permease protein
VNVLQMALRNVLRNKRRSMLTVISLAFGLGLMLLVLGYANAVKEMQIGSTVRGGSGALQVAKIGFAENLAPNLSAFAFENTKQMEALIRAVAHVTGVSPRLHVAATVVLPDGSESPVQVVSFDPTKEQNVSPDLMSWIEPINGIQNPFVHSGTHPMILGQGIWNKLKEKLSLKSKAGGVLSPPALLMSNTLEGNISGIEVTPTGVLNSVLPGDTNLIIAPALSIQELIGRSNHVTHFTLQIDSLKNLDKGQSLLQRELGPGFEVVTWSDRAPMVKDIVDNVQLVLDLLFGVFALVGALGIANTLILSVHERRKELGTLMALGLPRRYLLKLIACEGTLLGIAGGGFGLCLGAVGTKILHDLGIHISAPGSVVPVVLRTSVESPHYFASYFGTVAVALVASFWPAFRSTQLQPMEALRESE